MRSIAVERFSTESADPAARLAFWNDLASETFNNLVVDAEDAAGFHGEMVRAPLGAITLMSADSAAASVSRTSDAFRAARGLKAFDLHFQLAGRSLNSQGGREAMLEAGDFTLCDASRPYRVRFQEDNHMLCLKLPAELVAARLGDVEPLICRQVSARRGGPATLSAFLRAVWSQLQQEPPEHDWAESVSEVILDLLTLAYRPMQEGAADGDSRTVRRRQAREYIDSRLCDPDLGVGAVASALGVTPRYVQLLFAEMQLTPSAYIQDRRLELAAEQLRQGSGRGRVTQTALAVGFNDVTHFGRAFRRRFGVSPSRYGDSGRAPPWAAPVGAPAQV